MLKIVLSLTTASGQMLVYDEGEIGNITNLDAISSYEVLLDGRNFMSELHGYPRWCEPVRGLLARCIALAELDSDLVPVPEDWSALRVDIGIQSGRQRYPTRLAMCRVTREDDRIGVGFLEGRLTGFIHGVKPRESYQDMWDLAQHALNVSVWDIDAIPLVRPLVFKKYGGDRWIRSSELPEPLRSAFERRQRLSGRPPISVWDAHWAHDLEDFVNGTRDRWWL
jgi:hypothetical protein